MYDFGTHFEVDLTKSKTPSSNVFRGKTYRISILSDVLIRFEYSETGSFNDYPTFFASNRSFGKPKITVEEDNNVLNIITGTIPIDKLKLKAKEYNATITEFLVAVMIEALQEIQEQAEAE